MQCWRWQKVASCCEMSRRQGQWLLPSAFLDCIIVFMNRFDRLFTLIVTLVLQSRLSSTCVHVTCCNWLCKVEKCRRECLTFLQLATLYCQLERERDVKHNFVINLQLSGTAWVASCWENTSCNRGIRCSLW